MELDALLGRYEAGLISRRELLGALSALLLSGCATVAREAPAIGAAQEINHVTLFVRDVEASRRFYQTHFGMPVLTYQPPGVNLRAGESFLGLYPAAAGETPRIHHVCLGIDGFDAEQTRAELAARGMSPTIRMRGDTPELYVPDPDGILLQIQDTRYRGGVGVLGDRDPPA